MGTKGLPSTSIQEIQRLSPKLVEEPPLHLSLSVNACDFKQKNETNPGAPPTATSLLIFTLCKLIKLKPIGFSKLLQS